MVSTTRMNTAMTISQVRPLVVPMPARRRSLDQPNATISARNTSRISPGSIGFLPLALVPAAAGAFSYEHRLTPEQGQPLARHEGARAWAGGGADQSLCRHGLGP